MSVVNVFLYPDRAAVMTDGRTAAEDGTPGPTMQKVFPLAHLNAIVCTRGPRIFTQSLVEAINLRRCTFDDAARHLADDLRHVERLLGRMVALPDVCTEAYLVGLSEAADEFQCWIAGTRDLPGAKAFTPARTGDMYSPDTNLCDAETKRLAALARSDPDFNLERDGLALMQGQARAFPTGVGAFCQLTTVDRTEIRTRILSRSIGPCPKQSA